MSFTYTQENSGHLLKLAQKKDALTDSDIAGLSQDDLKVLARMTTAFNAQFNELDNAHREAAALYLANNPGESVSNVISAVTTQDNRPRHS